MKPDPVSRPAASRPASIEALHVFGLWALALAQPLYQQIAANPQFLAAHAAGRREVLALIAATTFLVPAVLAGIVLATSMFGGRARAIAQSAVVGALAAAFLVQIAKRAISSPGLGLALSVAAAAAIALAYHRAAAVRSFATFLGAAAVVAVPLLFVLDVRVLPLLLAKPEAESIVVEVAHPLPVVVVVLDELPLAALLDERGEIDGALFPGFARLSARAHWFRNATTTATHTELAIPALHTGRYVSTSELVPATLANYPGNLFTLLDDTHDLHVLETSTCLLPGCSGGAVAGANTARRSRELLLDASAVALHVVTPAAWESRLPSVDAGWAGFWADGGAGAVTSGGARRQGRVAEVEDLLERLEPSSRPPFLYLHPRFPHASWEYLPSGRRYLDAQYVPGLSMIDVWGPDEWLTRQGYQRMLLQVQAADRLIGELLDRLEQLAWLDDGVLIVTADHGLAFAPGLPRRSVPPERRDLLLAEIMPVPLFLKIPGQRDGATHDQPVELIDVLPTLADLLGMAVPWTMDGRSLLAPGEDPRSERRLQLKEPFVTLRFERTLSAPLAALARERRSWFGARPDGSLDLFRLGPDRDLVGLAVPAASSRASGYTAVLAGAERFDQVDPDAAALPVFVRGEIRARSTSSPPAPLPIAIAVNGVVRATTRTYAGPGSALGFTALLPEDALAPGSNDVGVYLVGDARELRQVDTARRSDAAHDRFTASRRERWKADTRTGWRDVQVTHAESQTGDGGELVIAASGDELPVLDPPPFAVGDDDDLLIALDVESPSELRVRVFYETREEPEFRALRFATARVHPGHAMVYTEVRAPHLVGHLRLDLVGARGATGAGDGETTRVVLRSIEVRAAD